MITVIRTATAFPGMTGEAIAWAKEVAGLVKRVTGKEQFVCTSFGGMLADIAWIGQYDSVGQYDEMRTKVVSEGEYRTALKKARDCLRRVVTAIRFGNTNRAGCGTVPSCQIVCGAMARLRRDEGKMQQARRFCSVDMTSLDNDGSADGAHLICRLAHLQ